MVDKTVHEEIRGTIRYMYSYAVSYGEYGRGIIIKPDDKLKAIICDDLLGRDSSQFKVGQRVVHVVYTWKRELTESEKTMFLHQHKEYLKEIEEFDFVTYDELLYDQQKQLDKVR